MVTSNYLYDAMIYIYALSLLFYFSDFVDASRRAKRVGTGLLIFVWVLQTGFFIFRMVSDPERSPVTMFEYLLFFSWLLITISLIISRFFRIEFIVFFVNVIGFAILTLNVLSQPNAEIVFNSSELASNLLFVHISLVICAFAAFTIGAIFSGMYLFLHWKLKSRKWSMAMRRLPSLETLERYIYRMVLVGTPLLILSLSVAITSILVQGQTAMLLDWKVFSSIAAVGLYIYYLIRRVVLLQPAWLTARWNLICFVVLVVNLFLNSYSSFHNWY
ncbi:cytochrome C assembly protein [Paenibacillaceae bacterium]|nr:cytochrome C assembly protein [Paenibacillaceae bacterium]